MSDLSEIEDLQISIKEMQGRLDSVRTGIESIERDIDFLSTRAIQLERNIFYLKKNKVVALASEYGKIKNELFLVKNKLSIIKINRENHRTSYAHMEAEIVRLKERLINVINGPTDNVVIGDFRRKND